MNHIAAKTEDDTLIFDISDEALEMAGGTALEQGLYTLGACTGLSVCPG
jgi:hypothetical protein